MSSSDTLDLFLEFLHKSAGPNTKQSTPYPTLYSMLPPWDADPHRQLSNILKISLPDQFLMENDGFLGSLDSASMLTTGNFGFLWPGFLSFFPQDPLAQGDFFALGLIHNFL
jgi:hypothetical protein